jgi:hypothetical protein
VSQTVHLPIQLFIEARDALKELGRLELVSALDRAVSAPALPSASRSRARVPEPVLPSPPPPPTREFQVVLIHKHETHRTTATQVLATGAVTVRVKGRDLRPSPAALHLINDIRERQGLKKRHACNGWVELRLAESGDLLDTLRTVR